MNISTFRVAQRWAFASINRLESNRQFNVHRSCFMFELDVLRVFRLENSRLRIRSIDSKSTCSSYDGQNRIIYSKSIKSTEIRCYSFENRFENWKTYRKWLSIINKQKQGDIGNVFELLKKKIKNKSKKEDFKPSQINQRNL